MDEPGQIREMPADALRPLGGLDLRAEIPALGLVAANTADGAPAGTLILLDTEALGSRVQRDPTALRAAE